MNRQEAIQELKRMAATIEWDYPMDAQIAIEKAVEALSGPTPDPITGLVPCGCGGKAILFHQPDIEGPGSDGDRWAVFCEKTCGMETSDMTSPECAGETWNTGMGRKREGRGSREGSVV